MLTASSSCACMLHAVRADPAVYCDTEEWLIWAIISSVGVAAYCLVTPLMMLWAAWRLKGSNDMEARERVALLVSSYRPSCWYMEAVDLIRKLLMTGNECNLANLSVSFPGITYLSRFQPTFLFVRRRAYISARTARTALVWRPNLLSHLHVLRLDSAVCELLVWICADSGDAADFADLYERIFIL